MFMSHTHSHLGVKKFAATGGLVSRLRHGAKGIERFSLCVYGERGHFVWTCVYHNAKADSVSLP